MEASQSIAGAETEFQKPSQLESIEYSEYEFDADVINFTYPKTVAPGWVDELSLGDNQSWLSATGVRNAFEEATSNFGLAETLNNVKDAAADILSSDSMPPLTAAVSGGPLGIAGGILIWLVFRDGDLDSEEVFDALLDVDLTPEAREQLERAHNLPPGTIKTFCELATEDTLDAIAQLQDDTPEDLRADIQIIESQFGEIRETVEALDAQIRTYDEILNIERATDGVDTIEQSLEDDEATVLDLDHEDVDVAEIPYQAGDDGCDERERIREAVASGGLILLRGPHGTGKTTAAFQAFRDLQREGYDIQLPQFSEEFARTVYEYSLGNDTEETILFNSFRTGTATVNDVNHIGWLLDWLDDDVCQAVVIECRAEAYTSLVQQAGQRLSNEHKNDYWKEKAEITFDRFSSGDKQSAYIEAICEWVLDQVGYDGEKRTKIIDDAVSFAEGNPEVAKIATRFEVSDSGMLSDSNIETPDDLLWHDIQRVVNSKGGPVFHRLCGVREANTSQLISLADAEVEEVSALARLLVGYLGGEIRETVRSTNGDPSLFGDESWTVSPDIYAETVFRREGIKRDEPAIGTYITNIALNDQTELYPNLAENLVIAHEYGQQWDQSQLVDAVEKEANDFLREIPQSDITPAEYCQCTERLAFGGLPVNPEVIETNAELLHDGTTERVTDIDGDVDAAQLMMNYLSLSWINHDPTTDVGVHDDYCVTFSKMARLYQEKQDEHPGQFLENVYSMAISHLADTYPDPTTDRAQSWLTELQTRATTAATSDDQPDDPGQFLANVYSMAISNLAETYPDPTTDRVRSWLTELQARATTAATSDDHDTHPGQFLENVYSMAIKNLADTYPDPTTDRVQSWFGGIVIQLQQVAGVNTHSHSREYFISKTFSMAIGQVLKLPHQTAAQWYPALVTRAVDTVDVDTIPQFCRTRESIHEQDDRDMAMMHVRFSDTVLLGATEHPEQLGTDYNDRVDRVSAVFAATTDLIWKQTGLSGEYFEHLISAVEDVEQEDPSFYADLVDQTHNRLDETHDNPIASLDWQEAFR